MMVAEDKHLLPLLDHGGEGDVVADVPHHRLRRALARAEGGQRAECLADARVAGVVVHDVKGWEHLPELSASVMKSTHHTLVRDQGPEVQILSPPDQFKSSTYNF